jgi:hypothetical protein
VVVVVVAAAAAATAAFPPRNAIIHPILNKDGTRIARILYAGMVVVASYQLFVVLFFKHTKTYYMFIYLVLPLFVF